MNCNSKISCIYDLISHRVLKRTYKIMNYNLKILYLWHHIHIFIKTLKRLMPYSVPTVLFILFYCIHSRVDKPGCFSDLNSRRFFFKLVGGSQGAKHPYAHTSKDTRILGWPTSPILILFHKNAFTSDLDENGAKAKHQLIYLSSMKYKIMI